MDYIMMWWWLCRRFICMIVWYFIWLDWWVNILRCMWFCSFMRFFVYVMFCLWVRFGLVVIIKGLWELEFYSLGIVFLVWMVLSDLMWLICVCWFELLFNFECDCYVWFDLIWIVVYFEVYLVDIEVGSYFYFVVFFRDFYGERNGVFIVK